MTTEAPPRAASAPRASGTAGLPAPGTEDDLSFREQARLFFRFFRYLAPYWDKVVLGILLIFVGVPLGQIGFYLGRYQVDNVLLAYDKPTKERLSLFFAIGLHPLGARWIQRHYLTAAGEQETFSYYGLLNILAFNVGYHNEHHDFPSVPWNKLPRIRAIAPEMYDNLQYHTSWTKLLFKFLFDGKISLFSRMLRKDRNGVPLNDEVTPDQDMIAAEEHSLTRV